MPFLAGDWIAGYRLLAWSRVSTFGLLVIPISLSFSLGFSAFVFLKSEGAIRRVVTSVTRRTLLAIESEIAPLLARGAAIGSEERERLKDLIERHEAVAQAASYKSFFLQGLSLIPLISSIAVTAKALYDIAHPK